MLYLFRTVQIATFQNWSVQIFPLCILEGSVDFFFYLFEGFRGFFCFISLPRGGKVLLSRQLRSDNWQLQSL